MKGIIAGHGTTSEQHVYKFTDTNAKPNVVYYYQIEDVSINGITDNLDDDALERSCGCGWQVDDDVGRFEITKVTQGYSN